MRGMVKLLRLYQRLGILYVCYTVFSLAEDDDTMSARDRMKAGAALAIADRYIRRLVNLLIARRAKRGTVGDPENERDVA